MYKYVMLLCIFFLVGCSNEIEVNEYMNEIKDNSVIFYNTNNINSVIIRSNGKYILYVLNGNKINLDYYYKFLPKIDYVISNNEIILNDNEINIYKIYKQLKLHDVIINVNDKIKINIDNNNVCIYDKNISQYGDYSECGYIYILNNENNVYITLDDDMNVLFYNEYSKFSNKFLEHLFTTWVDTYTISKDKLIILELESDYDIKEIDV